MSDEDKKTAQRIRERESEERKGIKWVDDLTPQSGVVPSIAEDRKNPSRQAKQRLVALPLRLVYRSAR
jgi:hypothetical protein